MHVRAIIVRSVRTTPGRSISQASSSRPRSTLRTLRARDLRSYFSAPAGGIAGRNPRSELTVLIGARVFHRSPWFPASDISREIPRIGTDATRRSSLDRGHLQNDPRLSVAADTFVRSTRLPRDYYAPRIDHRRSFSLIYTICLLIDLRAHTYTHTRTYIQSLSLSRCLSFRLSLSCQYYCHASLSLVWLYDRT